MWQAEELSLELWFVMQAPFLITMTHYRDFRTAIRGRAIRPNIKASQCIFLRQMFCADLGYSSALEVMGNHAFWWKFVNQRKRESCMLFQISTSSGGYPWQPSKGINHSTRLAPAAATGTSSLTLRLGMQRNWRARLVTHSPFQKKIGHHSDLLDSSC